MILLHNRKESENETVSNVEKVRCKKIMLQDLRLKLNVNISVTFMKADLKVSAIAKGKIHLKIFNTDI